MRWRFHNCIFTRSELESRPGIQRTQVIHPAYHFVNDIVHFLLGVEVAQAETNAAMSQFILDT